ncbi:hypothetical protein A6E01_20590 (plasmid) [Vibrio breoganii]|uniref:TfoX C-terminal domain-containing protein n=1 Tax=Vibrio breoganii TaxID=553239 RepID=A0AAN0Y022_9VIBR|nr:TfoX/Sxy family DNA transformation protein [Vibrio breoganii]ANO35612.1 hypothetical protein A6E01_20590 [Vibrio breoganii]
MSAVVNLNPVIYELRNTLEKRLPNHTVTTKQIFGRYISLSVDGLCIVRSQMNTLFFALICKCNNPNCRLNKFTTDVMSAFSELQAGGDTLFYDIGTPDLETATQMAMDIFACLLTRSLHGSEKLIQKGSIMRRLAVRLHSIGIYTVSDLNYYGIINTFHNLKAQYNNEITDKDLYSLFARVNNKNVLFISQEEKRDLKLQSNKELAKRIHKNIRDSHSRLLHVNA